MAAVGAGRRGFLDSVAIDCGAYRRGCKQWRGMQSFVRVGSRSLGDFAVFCCGGQVVWRGNNRPLAGWAQGVAKKTRKNYVVL